MRLKGDFSVFLYIFLFVLRVESAESRVPLRRSRIQTAFYVFKYRFYRGQSFMYGLRTFINENVLELKNNCNYRELSL